MATTTSRLEQELAIEQARVDSVYAHLQHATRSARSIAEEGAAKYASDRERYVREEDGTALFERDAFAFQAARRLAVLDAEHEGLVFGRLDLTDREVRYIGRIGVRDLDFEPLVIDWRARAAEPFYRATPAEPMDVVRRRVLRCRNDIVVGIEDDLLNAEAVPDDMAIIGEGALMAALSRARGHRMRDIVATIQAEQDEAIRAPHAGVTVIAGGPGTGKTVVGLHRTAYLLYSNRRRFENGGVLVVGPSPVFMNYIERVLPSLGEDTVTLRSLGQLASDVLTVQASRVDESRAAVAKGSLRMLPVLRRLATSLGDVPGSGLLLTVKGEPLRLTGAELNRIRQQVLSRQPYNTGRSAAEDAVVSALWSKAPEDLDVRDREEFDDLVRSSAAYRQLVSGWWPPMTAESALRRLGDPEVMTRVAGDDLVGEDRDAVLESYAIDGWSVADIALLDELVHLLGTPPAEQEVDVYIDGGDESELVTIAERLTDTREVDSDEPHSTYAHVLVDEAQDITPIQWRMLRRRGPQASWTIVGDPAQSSWPDVEESRRALESLIGTSPSRTYRLSTNYRSPAEVFDLASAYIVRSFPTADLPSAVRHTGVEPVLRETSEHGFAQALSATLSELLGQVEGTVAAIVPPSRTAEVRAVVAAEASLAEDDRLVVLTALEAKGLEHDGVLVVDPDAIVAESPGGERVLYVALTRATQRLVTLDVGGTGAWRP
ncbi:MAG TPA: UvrD-helicase domain-containing protein [Propionibacteriaceae bacterium]|nr:UvrD-helicase domain-containing protein [Propionibacteriaceae bacterium]